MFLSKFNGLSNLNCMVLSISKSVIVMILSFFDEKNVFYKKKMKMAFIKMYKKNV